MADPRRIFRENPRNPGYCLVIRPMRHEFDEFWNAVAEDFKETFAWMDVGRLKGLGEIMDDVLIQIARSGIVVADVSEGSANVFYELGIAHAFKGPEKVAIVTRVKGEQPSTRDVPFDVRGMRFLRYQSDSAKRKGFIDALKQLILEALEGTTWFHLAEGSADSPRRLDGRRRRQLQIRRDREEALGESREERRGNRDRSDRVSRSIEHKRQRARVSSSHAPLPRQGSPNRPCAACTWRLKSEGTENSANKHTICMVPDVRAKKLAGKDLR